MSNWEGKKGERGSLYWKNVLGWVVSNPAEIPAFAQKFVKGQLWGISDRFVKIGHVGRLLVHHRLVVPALKRSISRETLSSIPELQRFLAANNAVLVAS